MNVKELAQVLSCRILSGEDLTREVRGCYIGDLLSWVMGRAQAGDVWITIMNNVNVLAVASLTEVACVLLAEEVSCSEQLLALAREKDVIVLQSSRTAYELAGQIARIL